MEHSRFKIVISHFKNKLIYLLMRFFPIKRNKIIFSNFLGKGYGDNCKYICERLLDNIDLYDIVWIVSSYNIKLPERIRTVKIFSLRYYYEMATSKVWIDNCRKPFGTCKRNGQFYIQTWHGDLALKKIEADAEKKLSAEYVLQAKFDSKMADLFVSGSKFTSNLYRKAFWYNGNIAEIGIPRMEILLKNSRSKKQEIRKRLGLDENYKIVLYVPTFRNQSSKDNIDVYRLDWKRILNSLEQRFLGNWIGMLRLHPNISHLSNYLDLPTNVIDVTAYPDIQELLLISDFCITDYSSCMFEFAMTNKGVALYVPDFENYVKERDVYFSLNETPFSIAYNIGELESNIQNFDQDSYLSQLELFFKNHGIVKNENAAELLANAIYKICYTSKDEEEII